MMHILFVVLLACAGCIKPPPAPPMPSTQALELPAPYCASGDAQRIPVGICNSFTRTGKFACALCAGETKCVDGIDMVYCADSCRDPLCGAP